MITLHGHNGLIGTVSLARGKLKGSTDGIQHVADHMVRKHGSPARAYRAMTTLNNGYIWAGNSGGPGGAALSWDAASSVIDLYNPAGNPSQPRVPAGQAGGGQFTAGQQGGQKSGGQQQPVTAHQKHVAHLQHLGARPGQTRAQQKAALLKTASADRAKAAGILKQITALQKVIASAQKATGKTVKAGSNVTKATAGSTTAASASTKAAAASAAASKTAGKTASATAKVTASASQARKMLPQLQAQYKQLMTQAAQAAAAAAKL